MNWHRLFQFLGLGFLILFALAQLRQASVVAGMTGQYGAIGFAAICIAAVFWVALRPYMARRNAQRLAEASKPRPCYNCGHDFACGVSRCPKCGRDQRVVNYSYGHVGKLIVSGELIELGSAYKNCVCCDDPRAPPRRFYFKRSNKPTFLPFRAATTVIAACCSGCWHRQRHALAWETAGLMYLSGLGLTAAVFVPLFFIFGGQQPSEEVKAVGDVLAVIWFTVVFFIPVAYALVQSIAFLATGFRQLLSRHSAHCDPLTIVHHDAPGWRFDFSFGSELAAEAIRFVIHERAWPTVKARPTAPPPLRSPAPAPNQATELHHAAEEGAFEATKALLARGVDVNAKSPGQGNTALIIAATKNHSDIVRCLIGHGADVDARNRDGATALFMAAQRGHFEVVRAVLGPPGLANPDIASAQGASPLHVAAEYGHSSIAVLLLDRGARPDEPTTANGDSPLHDAALHGHAAIVALLLDRGADPNRRDRAGNTPLHVAAYGGHAAIVEQLLARGADRMLRNQAGFTPAELASDAEKADPKTKPSIVSLLERADAPAQNGL